LPPFFTSLNKLRKCVGEKLFSCTKSALFVDFSLPDFNAKCHILSTAGDALISVYVASAFSIGKIFSTPFHGHFAFGIFGTLYPGSRKTHVKVQEVGEFHAAVSTIGYPTLSPYIQFV
jgi:hypothetical protein